MHYQDLSANIAADAIDIAPNVFEDTMTSAGFMANPSAPTVWFVPSSPDNSKRRTGTRKETDKSPVSIRVLIVEDEILVAIDTRSMLETNGFVVVGVAASAEHAISIAEKERPDLVLMDIRLDGPRDGVEAAAEIRQRFDIPTIFVTANADARIRERAKAARPIGFLVKPFNEAMLLRAMGAYGG